MYCTTDGEEGLGLFPGKSTPNSMSQPDSQYDMQLFSLRNLIVCSLFNLSMCKWTIYKSIKDFNAIDDNGNQLSKDLFTLRFQRKLDWDRNRRS